MLLKIVLTAFLFYFLAVPVSVAGFDYLEPVAGPFNNLTVLERYYSKVKEVLLRQAQEMPVAMMVVMPTNDRESAVWLESDPGGEYKVVYGLCDRALWGNEQGPDPEVAIRQNSIDTQTAYIIERVFSMAAAQVRYPPEAPFRLDGVRYVFAAGSRAGSTWSPATESIPGLLVSYGEMLIRYSQAEPAEVRQLSDDLQRKGREVLEALERYGKAGQLDPQDLRE